MEMNRWTEALATFTGNQIGDLRRRLKPAEAARVRANLLYFNLASEAEPARTDQLVRAVFRAFGMFATEFFWTLPRVKSDLTSTWEWQGLQHLEQLNRGQPGWILAGAHTGNWEQLGEIGRRLNRRIIAPVGVQFSPLISPFVKKMKQRRGIISVPASGNLRPLIRALQHGDLVALPLDGGAFTRGETTTLLGKPVQLARGAALLSQLSARPVLPVFSRRTGFLKQKVQIHAPLAPGQAGSVATKEAPEMIMNQLMQHLGEHLRETSGQWCIFRPLIPEE